MANTHPLHSLNLCFACLPLSIREHHTPPTPQLALRSRSFNDHNLRIWTRRIGHETRTNEIPITFALALRWNASIEWIQLRAQVVDALGGCGGIVGGRRGHDGWWKMDVFDLPDREQSMNQNL